MVLHNDKWKYKSKKAYQRKHNLDKDNKPKDEEAIEKQEIDGDFDEEANNSTDDDQLQKEQEQIGNSWRFLDPEMDPELLRDPEYVEKLENQKRLEMEENEHYLNIVKDKIQKNDSTFNIDVGANKGMKSLKKIKDEELIKLKFDSQSNDSSDLSDDENIKQAESRTFSPEEKEKFLRLQKIIEHKKKVEAMKKVIDKHKPTKGQIYNVDTSKESDNYGKLVDSQLKSSLINQNMDLDDLVEDLLGVDLRNTNTETHEPTQTAFDLDSFLSGVNKRSGKTVKVPTTAEHKSVKLNLQDDFLDSIL